MKILAHFKLTKLAQIGHFLQFKQIFFFPQELLADYTQQLALIPFAAPNVFQNEKDSLKKSKAYNVPIILVDTAALWEFISLTEVSMVGTPNSYLQQEVIQALCR